MKRAPLKPNQVIRDFVIPRQAYFLQEPQAIASQIEIADVMIKTAVKHILHLHIHTPDPAFYASLKDGGFGLKNFKTSIAVITKKRIQNLTTKTQDVILSAAIQGPIIQALLERLRGPTAMKTTWKNKLLEARTLKELEQTNDDVASRKWATQRPKRWNG